MTASRWRRLAPGLALAAVLLAAALAVPLACGGGNESLTVYSGRSQTLVHPLLETFIEESGLDVRVKYAGSAAIAATILEEGENTPADVVFLQDPGSLGSLSDAGLLSELPQEVLSKVAPGFRSPMGHWVGTSGRARTVVYNTAGRRPGERLARVDSGLHRP